MAVHDRYLDGILRERYDDDLRIYTAWDEDGVQTDQRPYTAEENAAADVRVAQETQVENRSTVETNLQQDYLNMQAIEAQSNAEIRQDPSQEIKDIVRAVRRLTRMALDDFSGTE